MAIKKKRCRENNKGGMITSSLWNLQSVILLLENTTITINNTDTGL